MATCMAPPWPSQRRSGFNSERHTALARMRERQGNLGEFFCSKTGDLDMDPDSSGNGGIHNKYIVDIMMDDMCFSNIHYT